MTALHFYLRRIGWYRASYTGREVGAVGEGELENIDSPEFLSPFCYPSKTNSFSAWRSLQLPFPWPQEFMELLFCCLLSHRSVSAFFPQVKLPYWKGWQWSIKVASISISMWLAVPMKMRWESPCICYLWCHFWNPNGTQLLAWGFGEPHSPTIWQAHKEVCQRTLSVLKKKWPSQRVSPERKFSRSFFFLNKGQDLTV